MYAAYPGMQIIHRAGRIRSNVDPISRLRHRIPIQDGPFVMDIDAFNRHNALLESEQRSDA